MVRANGHEQWGLSTFIKRMFAADLAQVQISVCWFEEVKFNPTTT